MTYESKQRNRRTFLKGVAATGIGLTAIGPASAEEEVQYIVTVATPGS
jgi:hypothetical protein